MECSQLHEASKCKGIIERKCVCRPQDMAGFVIDLSTGSQNAQVHCLVVRIFELSIEQIVDSAVAAIMRVLDAMFCVLIF